MNVVDVLTTALGVGVLVFTVSSAVVTLVVPRGRIDRIAALNAAVVQRSLEALARLRRSYEHKDRVLALVGPLSLLSLLGLWLVLLLVGWALILHQVERGTFFEALRESGSSLFTLGFYSRASADATFVDFLAAGSGLLGVALAIAYLPVLYTAFSRRETLVTTLQSRAGAPAWGPEIIARHHLVGTMDDLPHFFSTWEMWAAEVAETHSSYPVLVSFRSPHPLRSWIVALLAVMDAAALYHATYGDEAPTQARMCIRMGFVCLRDIADTLGIPYDRDPDPDTSPLELTYETYLQGVGRLEEVGVPMKRTAEESWPHFRGWRVNYEALAYTLADRVSAPPAPWSGPRRLLEGLTIEPLRPIDRRPGGEVRRFATPPFDQPSPREERKRRRRRR